jgi:hypothetical protein
MRRRALVTLGCLSLVACAGYRGGWESLPYVGEAPPPPPRYRTPFEAQKRSELALPGLTLGVSLDNQLQSYDTEVYLYVVPASVDLRDVRAVHAQPGTTRVRLRVYPSHTRFVFRPQLATLRVGGTKVQGVAGFEFGPWDEAGNPATTGGQWAYRRVPDEYALSVPGETYYLSIEFPLPAPPPESPDIALDLSRALEAPDTPAIPEIRFLPVRWREGYS